MHLFLDGGLSKNVPQVFHTHICPHRSLAKAVSIAVLTCSVTLG